MPVFLLVRAIPVAILEVDSEVLDWLALELVDYERVNLPGQLGVEVPYLGKVVGCWKPLLDESNRQLTQSSGGVSREEVRSSVDRVNRLPVRAVPGIALGDSRRLLLDSPGPSIQ